MIIHTDGGSRGNPGHAATGVVVLDDAGKDVIYESGVYLGIATNNTAEYEAVARALEWVLAEKKNDHLPTPQTLSFKLDSQLVVEQLSGRYKIKQAHILTYVKKIHALLREIGFPATFTYVPRAQNAAADALVNQALDARG